jgi:hypothetical protein
MHGCTRDDDARNPLHVHVPDAVTRAPKKGRWYSLSVLAEGAYHVWHHQLICEVQTDISSAHNLEGLFTAYRKLAGIVKTESVRPPALIC